MIFSQSFLFRLVVYLVVFQDRFHQKCIMFSERPKKEVQEIVEIISCQIMNSSEGLQSVYQARLFL